jgi:ABC-type antimicrobial peptide transport system permease subunit
MAVVLAAIGVYGVLSCFVNQRTREMGIRFALGAQRGDVFVLVAKLGLTLAGTGVATGVLLALHGGALLAFSREGHRSRNLCRRRNPAGEHFLARVLYPCSPCHKGGSHDSATA